MAFRSLSARKQCIAVALVLLAVVVGAALWCLRSYPERTFTKVEVLTSTPEDTAFSLGAGESVNMWFHPPSARIADIALYAVRVPDSQTEGTVVVTLSDENGWVLARRECTAQEWNQSELHFFSISAKLNEKREYCLAVELVADAGSVQIAMQPREAWGSTIAMREGSMGISTFFLVQRVNYQWIINIIGCGALLWIALVLCLYVIFWGGSSRKGWAGWIWFGVAPLAMLPLVEWLHKGPLMFFTHGTVIAVAVCAAMTGVLFMLFGRSGPAQIVVAAFWWIISLINNQKISLRGSPLVPWDVFSAKTLLNVDVAQHTVVSPLMLATLIGLVLFAVTSGLCSVRVRGPWRRLAVGAASACGLWVLCLTLIDPSMPFFVSYSGHGFGAAAEYEENGSPGGVTATLISNLRIMMVQKPERYDPEKLRVALRNSEEMPAPAVVEERPTNIIVIMNESFMDLSAVEGLETSQPMLPHLRALREESIHGMLHMSTIGGGTAQSEFEVLTGNASVFLVRDSIAYLQYIRQDAQNGYSMAQHLKGLGYRTVAIHPQDPSNYARDSAYPVLGFDTFLSRGMLGGWANPENFLREHYADAAMYEDMMALIREKREGEPLFQFAVSIQNHVPYMKTYALDASQEVTRANGESDDELDVVLTLMNISDTALHGFIETLRAWDEPTLVLFFGDHQPSAEKLKEIMGGPEVSAEDRAYAMYRTPFLIWSNRGLPSVDVGDISTQYLGGLFMQVAGLPLSDYQRFLTNMRERWPVFSGKDIRDSQNNRISLDEAMEADPLIGDYAAAQYNLLFDRQSKQRDLFE